MLSDVRITDFSSRLSGIVWTRDLTIPGERSQFYRRAKAGEFTRVIRGAYLPAEAWRQLDYDAQYRLVVEASHRPGRVFSHHSAAAMWRLPWIGPWPRRIHLAEQSDAGRVSIRTITRHTVGIPSTIAVIDDITVTSLARTVVDLACTLSFERAVPLCDAALRRTTHPVDAVPKTVLSRQDLLHELASVAHSYGVVKAREVIHFADPLADRPGESVSRVSMHRAGIPEPQLQVALRGRSGTIWHVDFYWPEHGLIGEFDGKWKYTDPRFANGRTKEQILLDEKFREDDLRGANFGFVRWDWEVAQSPGKLRARLVEAGLPT